MEVIEQNDNAAPLLVEAAFLCDSRDVLRIKDIYQRRRNIEDMGSYELVYAEIALFKIAVRGRCSEARTSAVEWASRVSAELNHRGRNNT